MEPFDSDGNPYRPPDGSPAADPVNAVHRGSDFSWQRVLKLLACLLSVPWVGMLCVIPAIGAFAPTRNAKIMCAGITAAAVIPILLFFRGRWMYLLGLPVLLLAALAIYDLLSTLDHTSPWMRLP